MEIVMILICILIPVLTLIAIVKHWQKTAITLYLLAGAFAFVFLSEAPATTRAQLTHRAQVNVHKPYERLIKHLSVLAAKEDKAPLCRAIGMMSVTPEAVNSSFFTNTFAQTVDIIIREVPATP